MVKDSVKLYLFVIFLGLIFTIIVTWPFSPNLASYFTDAGDYAIHAAILWYNQDSLLTGRIFHQKEYFHGFLYYPHPFALAFANNSVVPAFIFAPFYWLTHSLPFSFNFYIFLAMLFSFLAAFYMIYHFMGGKGRDDKLIILASIIGAFIFAFNPQTMTRFPQHIDTLAKYFLPLIFLFAYKQLEKPSIKNAFWLFLFISLNSLTANYYQIFVALILPLAALPFLITNLKNKNWGYFLSLGKTSLLFLIFLPILLYFNLPYLEFNQKEGAERSLSESVFFSARINDFFAATPNNLIYGGFVKSLEVFREPKDDRGVLNYEEHTLFIGVLATILFVLGLKKFWRDKINHSYFFIILGVSFLLIFGPYFNGKEDSLPLPFYLIYQWVPLMKGIRAPNRFEYTLLIPFALIASYGAYGILEKYKSRLILVFLALVLILNLENFTLKSFDEHSKILAELDNQTLNSLSFLRGKVTLHMPIYTLENVDIFGKNGAYYTWLTQTREIIINGSGGYIPADNISLLTQIRQDPSVNNLGLVYALGANYVIIHKDELSGWDLELFKKNQPVYQKAAVFEDGNLMVLDLSKYGFNIPVCDFDKDISVQPAQARDDNFDFSLALRVENKGDCVLVSKFEDRYKTKDLEIDGTTKKVDFRMPVLIGPKEVVVLSEVNHEVKIR